MECMIAHSPSDCAFFTGSRGLVGLAFYTKVHDVISADSTVVNHYVPSPQSNSIPFFDFESFLSTLFTRSSRNFEITVRTTVLQHFDWPSLHLKSKGQKRKFKMCA